MHSKLFSLVAKNPYEMLALAVLKQAVKDARSRSEENLFWRLDANKFLHNGNGDLGFWTSMAGTDNTKLILKGMK